MMRKYIPIAIMMTIITCSFCTGCHEDCHTTPVITTTQTSKFDGVQGDCTHGGVKLEILIDGVVDDTQTQYICNGGPYVEYKNTSSKTYKYVHFSFIPYNAVGDTVADKPSSIKATGPEEPGPGPDMAYKLYKDNVWRDNTIDHIVIDSIRIEYMDGSEELLDGFSTNCSFAQSS